MERIECDFCGKIKKQKRDKSWISVMGYARDDNKWKEDEIDWDICPKCWKKVKLALKELVGGI
jgi:hypothetical protein